MDWGERTVSDFWPEYLAAPMLTIGLQPGGLLPVAALFECFPLKPALRIDSTAYGIGEGGVSWAGPAWKEPPH